MGTIKNLILTTRQQKIDWLLKNHIMWAGVDATCRETLENVFRSMQAAGFYSFKTKFDVSVWKMICEARIQHRSRQLRKDFEELNERLER